MLQDAAAHPDRLAAPEAADASTGANTPGAGSQPGKRLLDGSSMLQTVHCMTVCVMQQNIQVVSCLVLNAASNLGMMTQLYAKHLKQQDEPLLELSDPCLSSNKIHHAPGQCSARARLPPTPHPMPTVAIVQLQGTGLPLQATLRCKHAWHSSPIHTCLWRWQR